MSNCIRQFFDFTLFLLERTATFSTQSPSCSKQLVRSGGIQEKNLLVCKKGSKMLMSTRKQNKKLSPSTKNSGVQQYVFRRPENPPAFHNEDLWEAQTHIEVAISQTLLQHLTVIMLLKTILRATPAPLTSPLEINKVPCSLRICLLKKI